MLTEGFRDIEDPPDTGHTSSYSQLNRRLHLYYKGQITISLCHYNNVYLMEQEHEASFYTGS